MTVDLGGPWEGLSEAACTMSAEDFKKYATENFEWQDDAERETKEGRDYLD